MEVRDGYKQTNIGLIPECWQVKPLRNVLSKGRLGGNYPNELIASDFPLMKMGNLGRGGFDVSKIEYIRSGVVPEEQHRLAYGDVIFNTRNTLDLVGKIGIWRNELPVAYYNSNLMRFEFDSHEISSPEYVNYALNTASSISRLRALATGTTSVAAIYTRDLMELEVIVPTMAEQTAIATALSDVDALIAGLEKLIAKKRDFKQAAMQQLLTGQTRLPGFSGEWARNDLKKLVSTPITDGPHLTPTFYETGVPFLSVNNLANNRIDWSDLRFISKADDEIFSRKCKPQKGDVLLGKAASVGKVAIVEDDIDFNIWSPIALIRAGAQVNAKFLYYQLLSADCISQVMLLTNASSQGNIGMGDIEKIQISYPCYEEQEAIAEVLADMDAELASLETRMAKTRELKQGMMQELLTGRTRLV